MKEFHIVLLSFLIYYVFFLVWLRLTELLKEHIPGYVGFYTFVITIAVMIVLGSYLVLKMLKVKLQNPHLSFEGFHGLPVSIGVLLALYLPLKSLTTHEPFGKVLEMVNWNEFSMLTIWSFALEHAFRKLMYSSLEHEVGKTGAMISSSIVYAYLVVLMTNGAGTGFEWDAALVVGIFAFVYSMLLTLLYRFSGGIWWGVGFSGVGYSFMRMDDTPLPVSLNLTLLVLTLVCLRRREVGFL